MARSRVRDPAALKTRFDAIASAAQSPHDRCRHSARREFTR
jgi:hypothetical protein